MKVLDSFYFIILNVDERVLLVGVFTSNYHFFSLIKKVMTHITAEALSGP